MLMFYKLLEMYFLGISPDGDMRYGTAFLKTVI